MRDADILSLWSLVKQHEQNATNQFWDVFQIAARWHVTPETVRRRIRRGEIKAKRVGRLLLVEIQEVERFENSGTCC